MAAVPTRQSDRLIEKAEKEKEQKKEEERLARVAALVAEGLPADGSLEFRFNTQPIPSQAYQVRTKDVYRTADGVFLYSWAVEAFWDFRNFHPGQIVMSTSPYPQNDPSAKFNEVAGAGPCAATNAGPVGAKRRYSVVLWTTTRGLFVVPLFTLNGGNSFATMHEERIRDFVTLTTVSGVDPQYTEWAGHSIIMNLNPDLEGDLNPCCFADLASARSITSREYLQEDIGSLDGDEYLRFLSLYKIRSNEWLKQSFDKFESGVTFNDDRIVQPGSVFDNRAEYDNYENWQKLMADKKFHGMFQSKKAKDRYKEAMKKKPSKGPGAGSTSTKGPGGNKGPKPGTGGGGTGKPKSKPALGHKTTLDTYK
ncbi:hypothetical protein M436DRAFT_63547 [Aureobasidium namibiae CBS 147.97]|uniref:Uncharacterized protein n=1 Tax=Aureobasidium namibiae CBS 147.97 TaxID=1043004 RepID=A0A074WU12_9PEZI